MSENHYLQLFPVPKVLECSDGRFHLPAQGSIVLAGEADRAALPAARRLQLTLSQVLQLNLSLSVGTRPSVRPVYHFSYSPLRPAQGYEIHVDENGIAVNYSSPEGAYYAAATLKQILQQCGRNLPFVHISDQPD
ncbi:hypothetical protein AMQ83_14640, partial [Paenibacillus riograndensis]